MITSSDKLNIPVLSGDMSILDAALAYAAAGFFVIPIRKVVGKQGKNAGSVLGKGWQTKSSRDPKTITAWFAGSDDQLALHVGRSGCVVIDLDDPEQLPDVIRNAILAACPPFQRTRDEHTGLRGHFFFRDGGTPFSNATGTTGHDWGDVRGANGIVLCEPTVHPEGGHYSWAQTGEVPLIPDELASVLRRVTGPAQDAATPAAVRQFHLEHQGSDRPGLLDVIVAYLADKTEGGRHSAAARQAAFAARDARLGFYPADCAHDALGKTFESLFTDAEARGRNLRDEWEGCWAWGVAQAMSEDIEQIRRAAEERLARPTLDPLLREDFWTRLPVLAHIKRGARARQGSPDAVLKALLARVASMQSPQATTTFSDMGPASLNLLVGIAGTSAAGKSLTKQIAQELLPLPRSLRDGDTFLDGIGPGSGEGLLEAYYGDIPEDAADPKNKKTYRGIIRRNVFFYIDEGEMLTKLGERSGATFTVILRSVFNGNGTGQQNANADKTRRLPDRTYALGLVMNIQPGRAGPFFSADEIAGGTPQRFLWSDGTDPGAPTRRVDLPEFPGELSGESTFWPVRSQPIKWEEWPEDVFIRRSLALRGELVEDPLDGHRLLVRAKVAALLAVLNDDPTVTPLHYDLAGEIVDSSDGARAWVMGAIDTASATADAAATEKAIERARKSKGSDARLEKAATYLARQVHLHPEVMTLAGLKNKLDPPRRHLFDDALALAQMGREDAKGRYPAFDVVEDRIAREEHGE